MRAMRADNIVRACVAGLLLAGHAANAALTDVEMRIATAAEAGMPRAIEVLAETVNVRSATENVAWKVAVPGRGWSSPVLASAPSTPMIVVIG